MQTVKLFGVIVLVTLASSAFAGATKEVRQGKSNGSNVGVEGSSCTACGATIGGNGAGTDEDETTFPGSRADKVQALHAEEGRGRDKDE